jgi:hypothetical protein
MIIYIYILLYIYVYTPKVLVHQLESIVCGPLAKQPTGAPRQDTVAQLHSCWRSGAARQGLPKTIEKNTTNVVKQHAKNMDI